MAREHRPLPAPVAEVLARERADAAARPVVDRDGRIEPHGLAALAQPPVELVVLVGEQRLVPAPRRIERIAAEEPGKDHVGGPFRPAHAVAGIARAERGGGGERHRAPEPRGPDRIDPPAHVRRPGALERRDRAGEVARGQHRVRVAARDDRVGGGAERAVETGRRSSLRDWRRRVRRGSGAARAPRSRACRSRRRRSPRPRPNSPGRTPIRARARWSPRHCARA